MPKTIYLANPYGFSAQQKAELLPPLVSALEALGLEVWEPFERNNQVDFAEAGWAYRIGQADFRDVAESDAIFAVVNGVPPDEGVMVELGMAIALGKPTFPVPGRLPPRRRERAVPPEPDAVHRTPRTRLGGLLTTPRWTRYPRRTRLSRAGRRGRRRPIIFPFALSDNNHVRPEPVEGRFMVRQAHHERLSHAS